VSTITTVQGERWDELSTRVFGRPDLYPVLWQSEACACLAQRYPSTLPGGLVLELPAADAVPVETVEVPPWRK
jgi:phage tail protein X